MAAYHAGASRKTRLPSDQGSTSHPPKLHKGGKFKELIQDGEAMGGSEVPVRAMIELTSRDASSKGLPDVEDSNHAPGGKGKLVHVLLVILGSLLLVCGLALMTVGTSFVLSTPSSAQPAMHQSLQNDC